MPHKLKYDWEKIQDYYNEGHTVTEIQKKFGCSNTALTKAKKAGRFVVRKPAFLFGGGAKVTVTGKYSSTTRFGEIAASFLDLWGAERGWIISKPNVECSYDRAVDQCNGELKRVQVKYAGESTSEKLVVWSQRTQGKKKVPYTSGEIDAVVAYDPKACALYWLPPEVWEGKRAVTLRHKQAKNNQQKGVVYADKYLLH